MAVRGNFGLAAGTGLPPWRIAFVALVAKALGALTIAVLSFDIILDLRL